MSASVFPVPFSGIQETLIDAKGDLIVGNAADTPVRLAVGSNNQILTADSSVTGGIKWATFTPTFVGCVAWRNTALSLGNATTTVITLPSESIDTDSFHSTTTNTSRITIPSGKAGKYLFFASANVGTGDQAQLKLNKNGGVGLPSGQENLSVIANSGGYNVQPTYTYIVDAAVGDYYEMSVYVTGAGRECSAAYFGCQYLGA